MTKESETIVAAAMIDPDGNLYTLPAPARHLHVAQHYMKTTGAYNFRRAKQGFVTSTGRYVCRKEAREIAVAAGQVGEDDTYQKYDLFTEDIW